MAMHVTHVGRDSQGRTTHIGGTDSKGQAWGFTIREAWQGMKDREWVFYTEDPAGSRVFLLAHPNGYLTTARDGNKANNLDNILQVINPLSGTYPKAPDVWFGSVDHFGYIPKKIVVFLRTRGFFERFDLAHDQTEITLPKNHRFWNKDFRPIVEVQLRFPFGVYSGQETVGQQPYRALETLIASDEAGRRRAENAGRGWFVWDLAVRAENDPAALLQPVALDRFMEMRFIMRPSKDCWQNAVLFTRLSFTTSAQSLNPRWLGWIAGTGFTVTIPSEPPLQPAPAPRPMPSTRIAPNLIGKTVQQAGQMTKDAGFKGMTVFLGGNDALLNPTKYFIQTQDPGPNVESTAEYIVVNAAVMQEPPSYSRILLYNTLGEGEDLNVFTRDSATGEWKPRGLANGYASIQQAIPLDITLENPGPYQIVGLRYDLIGCRTNPDPNNIACRKWNPLIQFYGKSGGPTLNITTNGEIF